MYNLLVTGCGPAVSACGVALHTVGCGAGVVLLDGLNAAISLGLHVGLGLGVF